MPIECMAYAHMLLVQPTEAEQFSRCNHHLMGDHALEHLAHVHRGHRLQPETRPGDRPSVGHTPLQARAQALIHGIGLFLQALAQHAQVLVKTPALVQPRDGALADRRQAE